MRRGSIAVLATAVVAAMGLSQAARASVVGSTTSTAAWTGPGTLVFQTGAAPTTDSGGTTTDNDNWGGNANGTAGFGALAEAFEVTSAGTLTTAQMTMAGGPGITFNVELYNLGTAPAGYQAAPGSAPTITQINGVGGAGSPNLLAAGDQFTYNGTSGQNVEVLTFGGADAGVTLTPGNVYVLSLDPTANADSVWWVRGGIPVAAYNTGEGMNADGVNGLGNFEGKTSVRDLDSAITVSVPEPASIGLLAVTGLEIMGRRRRQA
jgi:hypothetical protein